jgi:hypothetical protein
MWCRDTTLARGLGLEGVTTDEVYVAMDWLGGRQQGIEASLAQRLLGTQANPSGLAYFATFPRRGWRAPRTNWRALGYSRDKKRGLAQIEYGLLTDQAGRPVGIEVYVGNIADFPSSRSSRRCAPIFTSPVSPWWATEG